jgi:hypothetical protein
LCPNCHSLTGNYAGRKTETSWKLIVI